MTKDTWDLYIYIYTRQRLLVQNGQSHSFTLQHTAMHCSALQHTGINTAVSPPSTERTYSFTHTATRCDTLQHTATRCNTLLHLGMDTAVSPSTERTWQFIQDMVVAFEQVKAIRYRSLLQKSPIKEMTFCKRDF